MAMLPSAEARGYFGPRRGRPSNQVVHKGQQTKKNPIEEQTGRGVTVEGGYDSFPPFNPQVDISYG